MKTSTADSIFVHCESRYCLNSSVAGYNAQAMVSPTETDGGATGMLVTAVDVVDAANDSALLVPMLEQAEETTGTKSQMTSADAGYFAASHLEECARRDQ